MFLKINWGSWWYFERITWCLYLLVVLPFLLFIQLVLGLMIHATWRVNVKNDEYRPQLIFDAKLLWFLDVLLVSFVSFFSECSLVMSSGSTVSSCVLFVVEFMPRLSKETSLWRKSGPTHHPDLLINFSNSL